MKKKIFAVLMAATMTVSMAATAFAADTTSNLIGKFTFDGNITNEVTGTDAKVIAQKGLGADAPAAEYTFPFVEGVDGQAIHLGTNADGGTDTHGLNLLLKVADDKNYTISFWAKADEARVNFAGPLVWMGGATQVSKSENWVGIWPGLSADYAVGPWLGTNDTTDLRWGAKPMNDVGLGVLKPVADKGNNTFEWTMITMVVKDSVGWLYYDGFLVGSTEGKATDDGTPLYLTQVNSDETVSIYLGANAWDGPFVGYIDDLYIYDRALETADVVQLVTDTNKAGVALGTYEEFVTTTTVNWVQKPNARPDVGVIATPVDDGPSPLLIGGIIAAVVVVAIVAVVIVSKSKKKGNDDDEE